MVLLVVRVYAGTIATGTEIRVMPRDECERVGRMFRLHANEREESGGARAGDIVAFTGLRAARTGDTLCAPKHPVVLERIEAPEPVIEAAIEPKTADDRDRLGEALGRMLAEDPSLRVSTHAETRQTILAGMGQLHLEIVVDRLQTDHRVSVVMGKPEVAYRETIARAARAEYRHIKQQVGRGQHAVVTLAVAPGARGSGITFADETVGGVVPKELVPAVEKGVRGAAERGAFAGYPVVDVAVRLVDGAFHGNDSNAAAFEIAGSLAFQGAMRAAGATILEPMTTVEAIVPAHHNGDVMGDISSRRAVMKGITPRGTAVVIVARAPLASMFDWASRLRSLTGGRGSAIVKVDGYDVVPEALAKAVLAKA
jgi:elongation factor G